MKQLLIIGLILITGISYVNAEENENEYYNINLDLKTIEKGYTVEAFNELKLSLVPGILNESTDVEIVKKLPYTKDYWFTKEGKKFHKFLTFFMVKADKTNEIKISSEHSEYKWADAETALEEMKFNKAIFQKILKNDLKELSE